MERNIKKKSENQTPQSSCCNPAKRKRSAFTANSFLKEFKMQVVQENSLAPLAWADRNWGSLEKERKGQNPLPQAEKPASHQLYAADRKPAHLAALLCSHGTDCTSLFILHFFTSKAVLRLLWPTHFPYKLRRWAYTPREVQNNFQFSVFLMSSLCPVLCYIVKKINDG